MEARHPIDSSALASARIRDILMTSLHLGRLRGGDRVPSVRTMARLTRLNLKTVHRAYRLLAEEGLLESRVGSGTYLRLESPGRSPLPPGIVADRAASCLETASSLGLGLDGLARFVSALEQGGLGSRRLGISECNLEQLGVIRKELEAHLQVSFRPILLDLIHRRPGEVLQGLDAIVTTDCHRSEVAEKAEPLGLPVFRIALSRSFPQSLIEAASSGQVLMVVRDGRFGPIFLRLLHQMGASQGVQENLRIVEASGLAELLNRGPRPDAVFYSTLIDRRPIARLLRGVRRLEPGPYVDASSVQELRAHLALDAACQDREDRTSLADHAAG